MPPDRQAWASAYARQSESDFRLFRRLLVIHSSDVEICHRLHYLQMACEKIAKAYRFRDTATSAEELTSSHVEFVKFVHSFLASPPMRARFVNRDSALSQFGKTANNLAREIERLAPAVDRQRSPGNAEYPWQDGELVVVPCDYSFPNLSLLQEPGGRAFLKLIEEAISRFNEFHIE